MSNTMDLDYGYLRKEVDGNIYPIEHTNTDNKHKKTLEVNTESDLIDYSIHYETTESESEYYGGMVTEPHLSVNN